MAGKWSRVLAGAAWLDMVDPGWDRFVDLDELDLRECETCVLGQVVKPFDPAANYLNVVQGCELSLEPSPIVPSAMLLDKDTAEAFGFDVDRGSNIPFEYAELTECWRKLIKGRRKAYKFVTECRKSA